MTRCLYCYKNLKEGEIDFHSSCIKKFFGTSILPDLPYVQTDIQELAKKVISSHKALVGVQSKLSMNLDRAIKSSPKLTIVGLYGNFILKPQSENYKTLPENESLSMHLAKIIGIQTVPFSLVRFLDNSLCYITHRIDRTKNGEKLAMEDMAQLTFRLSEDKYKSSYEQIAKVVKTYCENVGLDLINLAEQILFSWIIGNNDMHLKNFSLIETDTGYKLSPAYDMLNVKLVLPKDKEELALSLNGKKSNLKLRDFTESFKNFGLDMKIIENLIARILQKEKSMIKFLEKSFLNEQEKLLYTELITERIKILS